MEFGLLTKKQLAATRFILPPDPPANKKFLSGKAFNKPEAYVGCAKWGRKEWIGQLYPPKTKEKDFLEHYLRHFNSVELNASHYKFYPGPVFKTWSDAAANNPFKFSPKLYKGISHFGRLTDKKLMLDDFMNAVTGFGKHLGPVLIQLAETFSPKRKDELFAFLQILPKGFDYFLELRHPDWFAIDALGEELFSTLQKRGVGAVITDTAGRRDLVHMRLTVAKAFVRFVGNELHPTDYTRVDEWVQRIKFWFDNGLKELYFFMHMNDETYSPALALDVINKLNSSCDLNIKTPVFLTGTSRRNLSTLKSKKAKN